LISAKKICKTEPHIDPMPTYCAAVKFNLELCKPNVDLLMF